VLRLVWAVELAAIDSLIYELRMDVYSRSA
jgi:hypothetical protein